MEIEKDIKPPNVSNKSSGNKLKYKWNAMQENDSFILQGIDNHRACSIATSGRSYFIRHKIALKIIWRTTEEGVRFWAVSNK